jgi:hypothetical protein
VFRVKPRMSRTKRLVGTAIAAVALSTIAVGAPDSASAATSFAGTVTHNGSRVAGATVSLWRHDGYWVSTGIKTTTDASGRYYIGGMSNWKHYQLEAAKAVQYCTSLGFVQVFRGWSQVAYAQGGARGANIALGWERNVSCFP